MFVSEPAQAKSSMTMGPVPWPYIVVDTATASIYIGDYIIQSAIKLCRRIFTVSGVSQLSTNHSSISRVPEVIAYCAPYLINADFNTSNIVA